MASLWCPWCSAPLGDAAPPDRCPTCGAKIAPGAALTSPPATGARPHGTSDGDGALRPPAGAKPLPAESSDPTSAQLGTWAIAMLVVFALLAALAYVVGRPLLDELTKPTPTPRPSVASTPLPATTASPR